MVHYKCLVPGCTTGQNGVKLSVGEKEIIIEEDNKHKVLFRIPNDPKELQKWRKHLPQKRPGVSPGNLVCEEHFTEDVIERFIETEMPDGSIRHLKRSKPLLKNGAVPTIFFSNIESDSQTANPSLVNKPKIFCNIVPSNLNNGTKNQTSKKTPEVLTLPVKDLKLPVSLNGLPLKKIEEILKLKKPEDIFEIRLRHKFLPPLNKNNNKLFEMLSIKGKQLWSSETERDIFSDVVESISEDEEVTDFDDKVQIVVAQLDEEAEKVFGWDLLKVNLNKVKLPTKFWTTTFVDFEHSLVFINWTRDFSVGKKVVITKEMKYRVFLRDKEITLDGYEGPSNFDDLSAFLRLIEEIVLCEGIGPGRSFTAECPGHASFKEQGQKGVNKSRCDSCRKVVRRAPHLAKQDKKRVKTIEKLKCQLKVEKIKNRSLLRGAQKLKGKVDKLKVQLNESKLKENQFFDMNDSSFLCQDLMNFADADDDDFENLISPRDPGSLDFLEVNEVAEDLLLDNSLFVY